MFQSPSGRGNSFNPGTDMPPPLDLLPSLLSGLIVTVELTVGAAVVALLAAFSGGLGRLSQNWALRALSRLYVDIFRGTSALVQLFWVYFWGIIH